MKKFRCTTIVFTHYGETNQLVTALGEDCAIWYLYGNEICPTTGRKHLQGMASVKK